MDQIVRQTSLRNGSALTASTDTLHSRIFDQAVGMGQKEEDAFSLNYAGQELMKALDAERSARQKIERQLAEREETIARYDVFVREVDHRVKNSLQIVASMLSFQARHVRNDAAATALEEALQRVLAIAAVHEQLFRVSSFEQIDMKVFLSGLCTALASNRPDNVEIMTADIASIQLPSNYATKLGLIMTELVINALKHAFPDDRRGKIDVSLTMAERGIHLVVADDGVGLPADFSKNRRRGLGMRLIGSVLAQLNGKLVTSTGDGARFSIELPSSISERPNFEGENLARMTP